LGAFGSEIIIGAVCVMIWADQVGVGLCRVKLLRLKKRRVLRDLGRKVAVGRFSRLLLLLLPLFNRYRHLVLPLLVFPLVHLVKLVSERLDEGTLGVTLVHSL